MFVYVIYRSGAGLQRERFRRRNLGAAFQRAEFIMRAEQCRVYLKYPHCRRLVECVL